MHMTQSATSITDAIAGLSSSQSAKRRSAAKKLRKAAAIEACPALLHALAEELKDKRAWETQYHMIVALSDCGCIEAEETLAQLMQTDGLEPMAYSAFGTAIVSLGAKRGQGIEAAIRLMKLNDTAILEGALCAVACLRLKATPDQARVFVHHVNALPPPDPHGDMLMSIRVWLAAASAGWDQAVVGEFLTKSAKSGYQQLVRAATNSLKGEYVKWWPL